MNYSIRLLALLVLLWVDLAPVEGQLFTDISAVSGTANAGLYSTGCTWGDYDGDGLRDLYVTNWGTATSDPFNALFRNEGDDAFTDRAAEAGVDVLGNSSTAAFADYDNDGSLDLYVADFYDQDRLFHNQGDGSFAEVGRSRGLVDLERRGSVVSVAWGDYDNDGHLDIYLGKFYFANDFYANQGDGTFRRVDDLGLGDGRDAIDVSWCDYDNDGDHDLYLVNRDQENRLYRNDLNESSSFGEMGAVLGVANSEIGQSAAWGDYDNDGDSDLYLSNVGANALYRNESGAAFVDIAASAGVRIDEVGWFSADVAWSDLDGDGHLDLFLASGADRQPQTDLIYLADGDGGFRNATAEVDALPPQIVSFRTSAAVADYDGNGSPDIYATDGFNYQELTNSLFKNQAPSDRFLEIRVRGKGGELGGSNADGIGARVALFDGSEERIGTRIVEDAAGVVFGVEPGQVYRVEVAFPASGVVVSRGDLAGGAAPVVVEEP